MLVPLIEEDDEEEEETDATIGLIHSTNGDDDLLNKASHPRGDGDDHIK